MKQKTIILFILALLFPVEITLSHSGRTDSRGGHTNRKTGNYHYHNSGRSKTNYPKKKSSYRSTYRTVSKKEKTNLFQYTIISDTLLQNGIHKINAQVNSSENTTPTNDELKKIASNYWNVDSYNLNIFLKNEVSFDKPPWKIIKKRNGSLPDIFFN